MSQENWKKFIKKRLEEYKKIGYVECPIFGGERIYFTSSGFRHLIRKDGVLRSRKQQERRLNLFQYAPVILASATKVTTFFENEKGKSVVKFWSVESRIAGKNIIVVVRQINLSAKHFFSVFDEEDLIK